MKIKTIGIALVLIVAAILSYPVIAQNDASQNANAQPAADPAVDQDQTANIANGAGIVAPSAIPKGVQSIKLPTPSSALTYSNANYVTAGIGARNNDRGTVELRVPSGTSLVDAWVYWQILDVATPNAQDYYATINGVRVKGALIGSGPSPCWSGSGYAFRANIKSILSATYVSGGANGITVGGLNGAIYTGPSPWTSFSLPAAENANVVIIYSNAGSTVSIADGYVEISGGSASFSVPAGTTLFSSLISDGQVFGVSPYPKSLSYFDGSGTTLLQQTTVFGKDASLTSKATYQGSLSDTDTYILPSVAGSGAALTWALSSDCVVYQTLIFSNAAVP